ncbi:MAG: DUF86 domain-containing protein [Thermoproteota archaeon]|nr:DUF86 domain-containing protein [Thermoproteota archaeon]
MRKDPKFFLRHILESIRWIEEYTEGISKDDFLRLTKVQDAVIRRLEIVGEAVKNLPSEFREKYLDIPWRQIAGIGDVLIHGYFGVDLDLLWNVVKKDIPDLKQKISKIL